jgi:hypothetical protein
VWVEGAGDETSRDELAVGKTLDDFLAAHHPLAQASKVREIHANPAPNGTVRLLFTAAQNGTPVHAKFWKSLLGAKEHFNAHLSVIQMRHKNPTSQWSRSQENAEEWDEATRPYWLNQRMAVNKHLTCAGDVKIVPTAVTPLTGFEGLTGRESMIIGHTRYQMTTVPTSGKMAKILTTTGAATEANYSNSRAGAGGEHNHCLGAVLVELDAGGIFYLRHLSANDDGEFTDLDKLFTPKGVFDAPPPEAIILGDTHVATTDLRVDRATFGKGGLVTRYRPKRIVWHDVFDGQSVNPHSADDPFTQQALASGDRDNVEREVNEAIDWVESRTPAGSKSYVVASNHDDFLRRYIIKNDWKLLPTKNRQFYLRMAAVMDAGAKLVDGMPHYPSPFPYCVEQRKAANIHCLSLGEPLIIENTQCGYHGHKGPNGAKGSIKNMSRLGDKVAIAHGHGPGACGIARQVGHNAKESQPYTLGAPSSWMHTDLLIHKGGQSQLVTIVAGKHRL